MRRSLLLFVSWFAVAGLACSSSALAPDGGGGAGAAGHIGGLPSCAKSGKGGAAGLSHRAAAVACPSSNMATTNTGAANCVADSDCNSDAAFPSEFCVNHVCTTDQCLVDDDCAGGGVCLCAKDVGSGLVIRINRCTPATCRTDADCGDGGLCSPSHGYCGTTTGFNCRSAADTCCTPAQCTGKGVNAACEFTPTVGHWQCVPPSGCVG